MPKFIIFTPFFMILGIFGPGMLVQSVPVIVEDVSFKILEILPGNPF